MFINRFKSVSGRNGAGEVWGRVLWFVFLLKHLLDVITPYIVSVKYVNEFEWFHSQWIVNPCQSSLFYCNNNHACMITVTPFWCTEYGYWTVVIFFFVFNDNFCYDYTVNQIRVRLVPISVNLGICILILGLLGQKWKHVLFFLPYSIVHRS